MNLGNHIHLRSHIDHEILDLGLDCKTCWDFFGGGGGDGSLFFFVLGDWVTFQIGAMQMIVVIGWTMIDWKIKRP